MRHNKTRVIHRLRKEMKRDFWVATVIVYDGPNAIINGTDIFIGVLNIYLYLFISNISKKCIKIQKIKI